MYVEKMNQLETGVTARTTGVLSENVIDLGAAGGAYGLQGFIAMLATVAWDVVQEIQVITDDLATLVSAPVVVSAYQMAAIGELAVGKSIVIPIPDGVPLKRFVGLKYVGANTTGKCTAVVVPDIRMNPYVMVGSVATKLFSN